MPIKGYPSQEKPADIAGYSNSRTQSEHATIQNINDSKRALDSISRGVFRKGLVKTVTTNSPLTRVVIATSHGAVPGDLIRWESGNNIYVEAAVLAVPNVNTMVLSHSMGTLPVIGETFFVLRYITPRFDSTGLITATIAGGATETKQDDIITELVALNAAIGQLEPKEVIYNDYSSTPVTSSAYVELVASTSNTFTKLKIFDSSGYPWYLATGAAGSEVNYSLVPPGGFDNDIQLDIASGVRLSAKALSTTLSSGELIINAMGVV